MIYIQSTFQVSDQSNKNLRNLTLIELGHDVKDERCEMDVDGSIFVTLSYIKLYWFRA